MLIDSEPEQDANRASSDEARTMDLEEDELTPRPAQKGGQQEPAVRIGDENEPFQTPLVLKQNKRRVVVDSDSDSSEDSGALAAQQRLEAEIAKGKQTEESAGISKKKGTTGIATKPVGGYEQWVIIQLNVRTFVLFRDKWWSTNRKWSDSDE